MKNEKTPQVHQKDCESCDQVITLLKPNDEVRFCFDCIEKVEAIERMDAEEDECFNRCEWAEPDWSFSDDLLTEAETVHDYYADPKV